MNSVILFVGDPKGKHVIIVDDLVQTGGTLIESAKVTLIQLLVYSYNQWIDIM